MFVPLEAKRLDFYYYLNSTCMIWTCSILGYSINIVIRAHNNVGMMKPTLSL